MDMRERGIAPGSQGLAAAQLTPVRPDTPLSPGTGSDMGLSPF